MKYLRRSPVSFASLPGHTSQSQASRSPDEGNDNDNDYENNANVDDERGKVLTVGLITFGWLPPTTRWPSPSGRPRPSRPARGA